MSFSVLLPIYIGDKEEYVKKAIDSITNQTIKPEEVFVLCDGEIQPPVFELLEKYKKALPELFTICYNKENKGLGHVLREGVLNARNNIIARMDADDISRRDRFEKQLPYLTSLGFDLVGSYTEEFIDTVGDSSFLRSVPMTQKEILRFAKKRNPFNHMTVMFKRGSVLKAGNYIDCEGFEDYHLWVRMIIEGCKTTNIKDNLVYARTGNDMMGRRGGVSYIAKEIHFQKELFRLGFINRKVLLCNCSQRALVRLLPKVVREVIYKRLLRR